MTCRTTSFWTLRALWNPPLPDVGEVGDDMLDNVLLNDAGSRTAYSRQPCGPVHSEAVRVQPDGCNAVFVLARFLSGLVMRKKVKRDGKEDGGEF